jgi:ribosomal protein L7/L12
MSDLFDIQRRVADLERRVAELEGNPMPPAPAVDPEVKRLADAGNLISAIKRYRELTGVGLAEAKVAVERIQLGFPPT